MNGGLERFRAVSVVRGHSLQCDAAIGALGTRYLANQAPRLPVSGCDQLRCDCRYRHHGDRRDEPRRAVDIGLFANMHDSGEQRSGNRGRRSEDRVAT